VIEGQTAKDISRVLVSDIKVDIVFSDLNMPWRMSGNALAEWFHQQFPDVKVLLASGEPSGPLRGSIAGEYGPLLVKPHAQKALCGHIKQMLMA
jgi:DNA-binding NarL/FixJ family response regulator